MTEVTKITADQNASMLPADPMVSMIERVALTPDLPIERLSALMDMRERQMAKEAEQEFNRAFAAAMAEMPDVPRSGVNSHTRQKYSTLDDLIKAVRPILSRHGLSLNWQGEVDGDVIHVTAIVRHSSGHQINTTLTGKRDTGKAMNHLQGGGSTETYLKRYSGFSILGLSSGDEVDDDGRRTDANETITEAQYRELTGLIEKAGITDAVVCQAEKIAVLPDLPAARFAGVKSRLQQTIKSKEAA